VVCNNREFNGKNSKRITSLWVTSVNLWFPVSGEENRAAVEGFEIPEKSFRK
jgi:hypothetical protein